MADERRKPPPPGRHSPPSGQGGDRPAALGLDPEVVPQVVQQMISRLIGGLEERITIVGWPDDRARCLEILYVLAQCRDAAQVRIDELITDARYSGASWTEIGHAVGLTRQAAHSHYRRHNHNQ